MYINSVIESCDRLYPNEYSLKEKYIWCDELSAMLLQEYNKQYERIRIDADKDGTYLLPEGVTFEMIDRVFDGRHMIEKQDFRSFGVVYLSGLHSRIALPDRHRGNPYIDVVYLKKHMPIRDIRIENADVILVYAPNKEKSNVFYIKYLPFKKGDVLSFTVRLTSGEVICDNVAVLDINMPDIAGEKYIKQYMNDDAMSMWYEVTVNEGAFSEAVTKVANAILISSPKTHGIDIMRHVLDKTVCDAPYDSMYIDYVNAKICFFQRDYESYNQHMTIFNGRLAAYQAWLKERSPMGDDGKMKNWW